MYTRVQPHVYTRTTTRVHVHGVRGDLFRSQLPSRSCKRSQSQRGARCRLEAHRGIHRAGGSEVSDRHRGQASAATPPGRHGLRGRGKQGSCVLSVSGPRLRAELTGQPVPAGAGPRARALSCLSPAWPPCPHISSHRAVRFPMGVSRGPPREKAGATAASAPALPLRGHAPRAEKQLGAPGVRHLTRPHPLQTGIPGTLSESQTVP